MPYRPAARMSNRETSTSEEDRRRASNTPLSGSLSSLSASRIPLERFVGSLKLKRLRSGSKPPSAKDVVETSMREASVNEKRISATSVSVPNTPEKDPPDRSTVKELARAL